MKIRMLHWNEVSNRINAGKARKPLDFGKYSAYGMTPERWNELAANSPHEAYDDVVHRGAIRLANGAAILPVGTFEIIEDDEVKDVETKK